MNNTLPQYIEIPAAVKLRNFCIGIGAFGCLVTFGAFSSGDGGYGLLFGAGSLSLFVLTGKIKTRKYLKAKSGIYV